MNKIGFMQGRLSPQVNGKIQAFPWLHWRDEFILAEQNGFRLMEWTLDQERLHENPLLTKHGRQEIRTLCAHHDVRIESLTGDCFMQAPFYKFEGKEREERISDLKAIIDACSEINIKYVLIPLVDNGRLESESQLDVLAGVIAGLESDLRGNGQHIVFESDFGPRQLRDLMRRFSESVVGINYDIGNSASLGYDSAEELKEYGIRVLNVHVKDRLLGGTTVPLGKGNADFPRVFAALRDASYRGNFILQTARAADNDHVGALCRYRDMVVKWCQESGLVTNQ